MIEDITLIGTQII